MNEKKEIIYYDVIFTILYMISYVQWEREREEKRTREVKEATENIKNRCKKDKKYLSFNHQSNRWQRREINVLRIKMGWNMWNCVGSAPKTSSNLFTLVPFI
jgi:hypothetical protein